MDFSEFVLFVLGLILVCVLSGAVALVRSENPKKLLPLLLFVSAVAVGLTVAIGLVCYTVAWLWRNPVIAIFLLIAAIMLLWHVLKQGRLKFDIKY